MDSPDNHTGGLGVESSNLSAPTTKPLEKQPYIVSLQNADDYENGPNRVQKSRSGAQSPVKVPKGVLRRFTVALMADGAAAVTYWLLDRANARTWLALNTAHAEPLEPPA